MQTPHWRRADGACPACVQQALLHILTEQGEAALHESLQAVWPLDAEAAFGALPTPLRLHADPRFTGAGVTIALVDSAFYPHADLTKPRNRICAWVDAGCEPVQVIRFDPDAEPRWTGWDKHEAAQWHGLMTSAAAAGNGWLSHGLYRGLASDANVVLVQVRDAHGHITNASITRALRWLAEQSASLRVRVVNLSVAGDAISPPVGNPIDEAVAMLIAQGIVVVAAAGNDGVRRLVPPATAPLALTVGGLDDHNLFDHAATMLWHSNYGQAADGASKPEVVAPSLWVVAPLLPQSTLAAAAQQLFAQRAHDDAQVEAAIAEAKLVTPHYQHVAGTSFAAPIVASIVACMLQANPTLTPLDVRRLVKLAAHPVAGASRERQGAGAVDAGRAVTLAQMIQHDPRSVDVRYPQLTAREIIFQLYDPWAQRVEVFGSWNDWQTPALAAPIARGVWQAHLPRLAAGRYAYKFVIDGTRWIADPANAAQSADRFGGWNSGLLVPS